MVYSPLGLYIAFDPYALYSAVNPSALLKSIRYIALPSALEYGNVALYVIEVVVLLVTVSDGVAFVACISSPGRISPISIFSRYFTCGVYFPIIGCGSLSGIISLSVVPF